MRELRTQVEESRSVRSRLRADGRPDLRQAFGGTPERKTDVSIVPARKFEELLHTMPAERRESVARRVHETIAAMPLEELRRARRMTQTKLAETLGVNQGEVSKIEHRALGGTLEIRAVFPDSEVRITQFESLL
jgi:DNA-binding XRE family transcriptional regulator